VKASDALTLALASTVAALLAPGKGILAADENTATSQKRFGGLGIPCTEETRPEYREMLLTTPGLSKSISGVILFDETIRQKTGDVLIPEALARLGIVPGIKVDQGTVALANFDGEKVPQGLDGLRDRLAEYFELGARFTKWRAVIAIGDNLPTRAGIAANARALALFAARSQAPDWCRLWSRRFSWMARIRVLGARRSPGRRSRSCLLRSRSIASCLRRCCSRPAWCYPVRIVRSKRTWARSLRLLYDVYAARFRPRFPASFFCREGRAM
jgi:fructose-bisphosphate aldolase class I